MKRVNVESGINIIVGKNGRVPHKGFEVVRVRTIQEFDLAAKLFKHLLSTYKSVYMYSGKIGYRVEFKTYTVSLQDAQAIRNEVDEMLWGWEYVQEKRLQS